MAGTQGWVDSALEELMADRRECAERIEKLDAAIAAFRRLIGDEHPDAPARPAPASRPADPKPAARKSGAVRQQIIDALRKGPLSPASLAEAVGMETGAAMYHVKKLETSGSVVLTGASNFNRRVALPSSGPAKEAP
jgi:predicted Rossmann fold nucleotide-binding protein DprA/Smf involved in DNA uptake